MTHRKKFKPTEIQGIKGPVAPQVVALNGHLYVAVIAADQGVIAGSPAVLRVQVFPILEEEQGELDV